MARLEEREKVKGGGEGERVQCEVGKVSIKKYISERGKVEQKNERSALSIYVIPLRRIPKIFRIVDEIVSLKNGSGGGK